MLFFFLSTCRVMLAWSWMSEKPSTDIACACTLKFIGYIWVGAFIWSGPNFEWGHYHHHHHHPVVLVKGSLLAFVFFFFFLRTKEVAYVCCLPFMHPNLLWISFTKRRVFLSSSLSQEASDTRGHFHLSTQVCKDNRLLSHALLYFPCLLASGFEK